MAENDDRTRDDRIGHLLRRGIPILVLLGLMAGAYFFWRDNHGAPKHEPAARSQDPVAVTVMTVRPETVPLEMRFLGQTEASQTVEIRARVAGYLEQRGFKEGERVEKGQTLFQIDRRPFEVALAEAKAGLAVAEATAERASWQLKRIEEAVAMDAAAQTELIDWQTQSRIAAAQVQQQKALVAEAELQLGYTSIEAPMTGEIGEALKDTGSYIDAGQNSLLAILRQVDPIDVRYSITEQEMLRFDQQQAAGEISVPALSQIELEITLADNSTYPHRGAIDFIDVEVDLTTGTSVIRGQVPNPDGVLKPGQFIYANVLGVRRVNVLRVPRTAVSLSPSGASVFVVNNQGVAESRTIELGEWSGEEYWIIKQGLKPGDRVITSHMMSIRPGVPVTITGEHVRAFQPAGGDESPSSSQTSPAMTQGENSR